jgi:hypothetical protein
MSDHATLPLSLPPALTPEAEKVTRSFDERYQAEREKIKSTKLNILVWGPGSASSKLARKKREEIKEMLCKLGHDARFSEDFEPKTDLVTKLEELGQIRAADMAIVLLEDAPGALAETHDFAGKADLAWKFSIAIPLAYKDGYSANGVVRLLSELFHSIYWYTEEEIERCEVVGYARKRVELYQQLYAGDHS